MCSLSLIMRSAQNKQWQTQMEIEQLLFKYWTLVLDFQLCVLQLVCWVCCGDYHPWNVQLNVCPGVLLWTMWTMRHQTFSSFSFSGVEHFFKILCGKQNRGKGVAIFVDYLPPAPESFYEWIHCTNKQVCRGRCKCFKAACCAQTWAYAMKTVIANR